MPLFSINTQIELHQALTSLDRRQESRAFDYLYQHTYGAFSQWVFKHNGSEDDAADAFQKGLLNFVQNIRSGKYQYQAQAKITTVVFDYAKKIWLNELESSRLKTKGEMPINFEPIADGNTPFDDMSKNETVVAVQLALGQLKGDCQKVIQWFYVEELSIKDIAAKLGMKESSTKQKRFDCTEKLKNIFMNISKKL